MYISRVFYPNDTLWDGAHCDGFEGPCCTQSNVPWSIKTLAIDQHARDDIELRVCSGKAYTNEDMPVIIIELTSTKQPGPKHSLLDRTTFTIRFATKDS